MNLSDGAPDAPRDRDDAEAPPREPGFFERVSGLGVAAQALIPGFYAWAVTVAPAAWSRGAPFLAKPFALAGIACLIGAVIVERKRPTWSRAISVWGLVLTSAIVWALTPLALSPQRLDVARGVAGMIGWALFAFSSAAPALRRDDSHKLLVAGPRLRPRGQIPRGDVFFLVVGVLLALALQTVGWRAVVPERALLVRLVALASGLAVLGAATSIALTRHMRRPPASRKTRMRRSLVWLLVLGGLIAIGAAVHGIAAR